MVGWVCLLIGGDRETHEEKKKHRAYTTVEYASHLLPPSCKHYTRERPRDLIPDSASVYVLRVSLRPGRLV